MRKVEKVKSLLQVLLTNESTTWELPKDRVHFWLIFTFYVSITSASSHGRFTTKCLRRVECVPVIELFLFLFIKKISTLEESILKNICSRRRRAINLPLFPYNQVSHNTTLWATENLTFRNSFRLRAFILSTEM